MQVPTSLDIHDAIIVATALVFRETLRHSGVVVVTKDANIIAPEKVQTLW